ncbi:MAG: tryptophan--tRNA ligase [Deltaproteobacteria bacterium]|nr:tryptophan--tRNA ligase [Deltaproteobacteria bacterium]
MTITEFKDSKLTTNSKKRVVSGMRPTGRLHLGHFHGVLENWIQLQENYECFFFVADWHSLTTEYANTQVIKDSVREILIDWLAAGVDPQKSTLFVQSRVPEHAELHLLLSMITPISWLERVPSYKELKNELKDRDLSTYGFLGYPLLQTADVAIYQANQVPVGQDQLAHLELSREVLRRFNYLYGDTFVEPQSMLTASPKLLGTDGRKMSKSYGNSIYLSDPIAETEKKVMAMMTDPARKKRQDAGNPDICPVFDYQKIYNPEKIQSIAQDCRTAAIGCVDDKKMFLSKLIPFLEQHQAKRKQYEQNPALLDQILEEGTARARKIAQETLKLVYERMKI